MFYKPGFSNYFLGEDEAAQELNEVSRVSVRTHHQIEGLAGEVERLLMITEALWDVLKEQHGYTDDELMRRIALIDLRDGKLDGKVAKGDPAACPKCNRRMGRRRHRCIYCGEAIVQPPFAR